MPFLRTVRYHRETKPFIDVGREDRTLQRARNDRRRQEKALIQAGQQSQICADLLPEPRRREPVSAALDKISPPADITADGSQAAAGVFDERADDHVSAHVRRFQRLDKLSVAVIHHADHIRLDLLAERNQLADLRDRVRRPRGVSLGALDGDELRLVVDGRADGVIVKRTVGQKLGLPVADAVLF